MLCGLQHLSKLHALQINGSTTAPKYTFLQFNGVNLQRFAYDVDFLKYNWEII